MSGDEKSFVLRIPRKTYNALLKLQNTKPEYITLSQIIAIAVDRLRKSEEAETFSTRTNQSNKS